MVGRDSDIQLTGGSRIGYFSQNLDVLTLDKTILENVKETSRQTEQTVRDVLARLLFKQDAIYKTVRVLSGREKVKVALAKIMVSDIDMMILDEPTTYLDTPTIQALEVLLTSYIQEQERHYQALLEQRTRLKKLIGT
ncbi:ABC transporter ATP-binding protein [Brevibacillus laterosporus]|nr:ABC transporter ATP-binding protein [Brevibacillus laterosporus]